MTAAVVGIYSMEDFESLGLIDTGKTTVDRNYLMYSGSSGKIYRERGNGGKRFVVENVPGSNGKVRISTFYFEK
jgi:hypothetical protein